MRPDRAPMNASEALSRLRGLGTLAVTTSDAAALLQLAPDAASHTLRRLAAAGLVTPVRRALWGNGPSGRSADHHGLRDFAVPRLCFVTERAPFTWNDQPD